MSKKLPPRVPVTLRMPPALSAQLTKLAAERRMSLNQYLVEKLESACEPSEAETTR